MRTPEMLWIDLETTGLDADTEVPLELGLCVTDRYGKIIAERSWLIHDETSEYKEKIAAAKQHEIVGPMHEKSGLWADLDKREVHNFGQRYIVDADACSWLDDVGVPVFKLPMAGSSIGSLDRPFCITHLPNLHKHFHYRNLDVSSIKEAARLRNTPIFEAEPTPHANDSEHRVLDDIHWSIELWRFYCREFLMVADD